VSGLTEEGTVTLRRPWIAVNGKQHGEGDEAKADGEGGSEVVPESVHVLVSCGRVYRRSPPKSVT
jgi:hypothetical protein